MMLHLQVYSNPTAHLLMCGHFQIGGFFSFHLQYFIQSNFKVVCITKIQKFTFHLQKRAKV